jgi:hypothetical protein
MQIVYSTYMNLQTAAILLKETDQNINFVFLKSIFLVCNAELLGEIVLTPKI